MNEDFPFPQSQIVIQRLQLTLRQFPQQCFAKLSDSLSSYGRSLPESAVHGILQARILEWVAMPSSRGSSQPRGQTNVSRLLQWQAGSLLLAPPGKPLLSGERSYLNWWRFSLGGDWHRNPANPFRFREETQLTSFHLRSYTVSKDIHTFPFQRHSVRRTFMCYMWVGTFLEYSYTNQSTKNI